MEKQEEFYTSFDFDDVENYVKFFDVIRSYHLFRKLIKCRNMDL